jgi:hypothetical protein
VKKTCLFSFVFVLAVGCGSHSPPNENLDLIHGSVQEKSVIAKVKRLSVQHGYHTEEMELEVKSNSETGDFSIFIFPKPLNAQHLRRELGLFDFVNSKSGQVIRFSDPALEPRK